MNKAEFLSALADGIAGLPERDVERSIDYYAEMIDDYIEDGMSEEEAVEAIGPVFECVEQILSEIPFSKIVRERIRPKRRLRGWEVALIVIGSPVWFPLVLTAVILVLALFVVIWSLAVSLYAIDISFAAAALAAVVVFFPHIFSGETLYALFVLGIGISCSGLAIVSFIGSAHFTNAMAWLSRKIFFLIKSCFVRKGDAI